MMGLQDASRFVEYMPDDQLAREVQAQTIVPSYVALAEVARRNDMRNSQQNPPQPTVADSEVSQLMGSAGISSNQPLSSPMGESPVGGDVPASGLRMMAKGGITGYNEGGMSYYDRALGAIKGRYMDEDGFDKSQIASDLALGALTFTPAGLAGRGLQGILAASKFLKPSRIGRGLRRFFTGVGARTNKDAIPFGKVADLSDRKRMGMLQQFGKQAVRRNVPRVVGAGLIANEILGDDEAIPEEMGDDLPDTQPSVDRGIGAISRDTEASIDPFDMARMGFALMGARDTSELAKGLGSIAEDIQTRRREAPLVKAQLAELQAKVNYYNNQGQYGLADQLYKIASTLSAQYSALYEAGQDTSSVVKQLMEVNKRYADELGIETPSEQDVIARNLAD